MDEVFNDEQAKVLQLAAPVEQPTLGPLRVVASPLNLESVPRRIRRASPDPGANSDQILGEPGYSREKFRELRTSVVC